ncbi:MAG: sulfatase [Planctomycetaceae bacterium]|nr:sulfatase [Planctomycetaceae bacterium]
MDKQLLLDNTRRQFLSKCVTGMGAAALGSLLSDSATRGQGHAPSSGGIHFAARAKRVIYLHMAGGPSQLDLFDHKPLLTERNGQLCPEEFFKGKRFAFIKSRPKLLGTPFRFAQYGDSGAAMCQHVPHLSRVVDDLCFIKSMHTDQFNHAPAQLFMQTGSPILGRPSLGSWMSYGLGTENRNLPAFVVLVSGQRGPSGGTALWGNGFLPSVHQGVRLRSRGDPVLFLTDPPGISRRERRLTLDSVQALNRIRLKQLGQPEIATRIEQFELAYRMQRSVPELMAIDREPAYIHKLYGTEPGQKSYANNCLLARRLIERGSRFVQLYHWGWDSHGSSPAENLRYSFVERCRQTDQATAALLVDLKQRGLLDDTLVVWGGEFGRTPMAEVFTKKYIGRDHHQHAFTIWMAGGGVKPGISHGRTDPFGYAVVENPVHVHDLQATILHLMGIDHEALTYRFQGRDFRLTDVHGQVVREVVA